jgi:hypothetical protein
MVENSAKYQYCSWGVLECEGKKRWFAEDQVCKGESLFFFASTASVADMLSNRVAGLSGALNWL